MTEQNDKKLNVKSFELDHRLVSAPYIRVADRTDLGGGVEIIKYDLRFCQPNRAHLEMEAVHSIEHLSAELMRNHTDRLIDFSWPTVADHTAGVYLAAKRAERQPQPRRLIVERPLPDYG